MISFQINDGNKNFPELDYYYHSSNTTENSLFLYYFQFFEHDLIPKKNY